MSPTDACRWQIDDNGAYDTGCGNTFELIDGTPAENRMRFCPYCGRTLVDDSEQGTGNAVQAT